MLTDVSYRLRSLTRIGVVVVLLVGIGVHVFLPSPAEASTRRYHYIQFNTCDNKCRHLAGPITRSDEVVGILENWYNGYLFASLNELCRTTAENIVFTAQARGLNIGGHFTETSISAENCSSYGNMVMHPGARLDVGETLLTWDGSSELRKLTCVSTTQPGQLRMCTTHVTRAEAFKDDQIRGVSNVVDPYATGAGYIVVGGDFNQTPISNSTVLKEMYAGYGGYFDDVDRAGSCNDSSYNQFTKGSSKFDYIFVDHTRFSCYGGKVDVSDVSDHRVLRGAADLNY